MRMTLPSAFGMVASVLIGSRRQPAGGRRTIGGASALGAGAVVAGESFRAAAPVALGHRLIGWAVERSPVASFGSVTGSGGLAANRPERSGMIRYAEPVSSADHP